jgi:hypothetical protein
MTDLSEYVHELPREDPDFTFSQVAERDTASVVNLWIRFLNVTRVKTELFGRLR